MTQLRFRLTLPDGVSPEDVVNSADISSVGCTAEWEAVPARKKKSVSDVEWSLSVRGPSAKLAAARRRLSRAAIDAKGALRL